MGVIVIKNEYKKIDGRIKNEYPKIEFLLFEQRLGG